MAQIKVTQIKSGIGTKPKHRGTLNSDDWMLLDGSRFR